MTHCTWCEPAQGGAGGVYMLIAPSRCIRKLTSSPDYLIGLEEERRGDGQAQFLRGLQVDDQLELHGLLHGQVGGLGTLQDLIHIPGYALELVRTAHPIADEAARLHKWPDAVHGRQAARGRELDEPPAVRKEHGGVRQDEERLRVCTGH